jgi:hypothetical protein
MAGIGGLPYFIQAQGQLQAQEQARQQAQMQLQAFQQQQQDRQRLQAAQAAAGNALPQLFAGGQPAAQPQGQMPPPPQPPAPGQSSQPAPQAGGGVPLPQGPVPGQVARPPIPPGGVQGQMPPPGVPPFRPMPTTPPPQQAAPSAISAPPAPTAAPQQQQGGPLTLQSAIKVLQGQGLSGADLFAGLQQLTPLLDAQSKAQAAQLQQQFTHELQVAQLQERYDALRQTAQDRQASLEERAQAHQDSLAIREQMVGIQAQNLKLRLAQGDDSKLTPDEAQVMGEQLAKGDTSVLSNLGRGTQGAANVVAVRKAALQYAKDNGLTGGDLAANVAGFGGEKAAARTGATRAANIGMAVAEAQQTFPLVRQTSAALPRSQFVPVNRALQAAESNTGDPKVVAFGAALNTAINAYARAISPTGTPTVSDKEHAREILSTASTPEQVNAALDVMEKEMSAARQAPTEVQAQQRARISGRGEGAPAVGTIEGGYRFKGGDPAVQSNWEKQ